MSILCSRVDKKVNTVPPNDKYMIINLTVTSIECFYHHLHILNGAKHVIKCTKHCGYMMTPLNGYIFRVTGPLWGEFTGDRWIPSQRPVTRRFELRLNKRLGKQSWGWWFETPSCSLWRHCNVNDMRLPYFMQGCSDFDDYYHLWLHEAWKPLAPF